MWTSVHALPFTKSTGILNLGRTKYDVRDFLYPTDRLVRVTVTWLTPARPRTKKERKK